MERKVLESQLKQAEEQVRLSERIVSRLRVAVMDLEQDVQNTSVARVSLRICEDDLQAHIKHRDELEAELDKLKP